MIINIHTKSFLKKIRKLTKTVKRKIILEYVKPDFIKVVYYKRRMGKCKCVECNAKVESKEYYAAAFFSIHGENHFTVKLCVDCASFLLSKNQEIIDNYIKGNLLETAKDADFTEQEVKYLSPKALQIIGLNPEYRFNKKSQQLWGQTVKSLTTKCEDLTLTTRSITQIMEDRLREQRKKGSKK